MRRRDFVAMVRRMERELPATYLEGIAEIGVSEKTVPDPVREGVYILGECISDPFAAAGDGEAGLRSSVVLHYGSFAVLARSEPSFDWQREAWGTLTHEVRHHLEWRARVRDLEALDGAVEANYARRDGEPFAPLFYLDGEPLGAGLTKVGDDVFVDIVLDAAAWRAAAGGELPFRWHGRPYRAALPAHLSDVHFLEVRGVRPPPAGELVLVVRRKSGARDLVRRLRVARGTSRARCDRDR